MVLNSPLIQREIDDGVSLPETPSARELKSAPPSDRRPSAGIASPSDTGAADPTDAGAVDSVDAGATDPTDEGAVDPTNTGAGNPTDADRPSYRDAISMWVP